MAKTFIMDNEMRTSAEWVNNALDTRPPFSFSYKGVEFKDTSQNWDVKKECISSKDSSKMQRVSYRDIGTGLECTLEICQFDDFPAAEWVVKFKNTGSVDTPVIENIQALDIDFGFHEKKNYPWVHYSGGTRAMIDDFKPYKQALYPYRGFGFHPAGRKYLPFFNLEMGDKGAIIAIGWTGNWAAGFMLENSTINVKAGMEKTCIKLHPGEEIRSPRILLLFWENDITRSHNMLRRFIVKYHTPRFGSGGTAEVPLSCATWGGMKTHNHIKNIKYIKDKGLDYDCYWIDAGWFGPEHETDEFQNSDNEDWFYNVGDWRVNPAVHPNGFKEISEAAHNAGMKFMLWVEPERAIKGSPITLEHPEWFIGEQTFMGPGFAAKREVTTCILNLGNPEARKWATDLISGMISEHGIDYYRQDSNIGGWKAAWEAEDEPDRQGITEIRHVEGLYEFWDELLRRHPGLLIDNCASGGNRFDLETLGRSIVLWRSDCLCSDPISDQVESYGLSFWVPLNGGGRHSHPGDTYNFRSCMSAGMVFSILPISSDPNPAPDYPWEWHRAMIAQYKKARKFYYGDFYPLTGCSISAMDWLAYQMDRPDLGEGMVLFFRRQESAISSVRISLKGLEADAEYELEDVDAGKVSRLKGAELLDKGICITLEKARESCLVFYKKI